MEGVEEQGQEQADNPDPSEALLEAEVKRVLLEGRASTFCRSSILDFSKQHQTPTCKAITSRITEEHSFPVSNAVAARSVVEIDTEDEEIEELFQNSYDKYGRVTHLEQVMAWHPSFLACFQSSYSFIMNEDGPLPLHWRNYIAMMAASATQSSYMMDFSCYEFIIHNGPSTWLRGLGSCPSKLASFAPINTILCHRPWLLTKDHISTLLAPGLDAWSITELTAAIIIAVTHHSLSSFVLALGVSIEQELELVRLFRRSKLDHTSGEVLGNGIEENDDKKADETNADSMPADLSGWLQARLQQDPDTCIAENTQEAEKAGDGFDEAGDGVDSATSETQQTASEFAPFLGSYQTNYEDFDVKSKEYRIFRTSDYSWREHGYPLANKFYPSSAELVEQEFDRIYNLTYNTYGGESVRFDTGPFRRAIWYYVLRLMGINKDDYNYQQVNVYLDRKTKTYVKKVCCHPHMITRHDIEQFSSEFTIEEKCHINLIVMEARKQACLLYGLRGVMEVYNM